MSKRSLGLILILLLDLLVLPSLANDTDRTLDLPQPSGRYAIGTTTWVASDVHRSRDLLVTAWYPAVTGSAVAPYMDKRTAAALAAEWKLQSGFEQHVRTHAGLHPAIVAGGTFPVILLEHGSGVVPAIYTVLAEGLASSGFIVVAANHPPDSLIAVFPDGHEVHTKPYWPVDADHRTQGIAIGRFAEDVLVADVRFILDQLQQMDLHDSFWRRHLDLSRVGIVGHSMGGTTAALATRDERRISVGVNLDGSTFPGMNADIRPIDVHKPLLFLATEEHASNPDVRAREYVGTHANTYYVTIAGNDHMGFTDARLLQARFSKESSPDRGSYEHALLAVELTRSLVEEFLGKYLKSSIAPELDALVGVDKK